MEDKNTKPVDKKQLKKPTGKSATGKPLDGVDIRPQLKDTDSGQQNEEAVDLTTPLEEKALTLVQRQRRARILRRRQRKLQRAREIAKRKIAPKERLEARAMKKARNIVKQRLASRRGTPYAQLSTAEKIQVDKKAEKKVKLIQKIAKRILPKVRRAEYERLASFRKGEALKDLSTPKNEEFNKLVESLDNKSTLQLVDIISESINVLKDNSDPLAFTLKRLLNAVIPEDATTSNLMKKAEKNGIPFSTLREVFERGCFTWDEETSRVTKEQFAFSRVNSYIAKGRAWKLDADLREEKKDYESLNKAFASILENGHTASQERMQIQYVKRGKKKPDHSDDPELVKRAHDQIKKKVIDEACWDGYKKVGMKKKGKKMVPNCVPEESENVVEGEMKPYVKPHDGGRAWKASNKWGKVKYFGKDFKAAAEKHAKINEDSPAEREVGTDSLTKKYKKQTPGQEKSDLNESFNMAFTSGIGVTLSAEDCGIKIEPGFELHPDVIDEIISSIIDEMDEMEEEVRSADIEGVIVRTASGKTVVRKQKRNRKIIGSGNLTDGKPDDEDV